MRFDSNKNNEKNSFVNSFFAGDEAIVLLKKIIYRIFSWWYRF